MSGWSLSAGYWTVWRGLSLFAGAALAHRRRGDAADAPGLPRPQQMAARDAAIMRTAVVGVGYLGRFHAQKYSSLAGSELVGVADPSPQARAAVAAELGVPRNRRLSGAPGTRRCGEHRDTDAAPLCDRQGVPGVRRARAGREAHDRDAGGGRESHRGGAPRESRSCRWVTSSDSTRRCRPCSRSCPCRGSSSRRGSPRSSNAAPTWTWYSI